jgi:hypothetical protein
MASHPFFAINFALVLLILFLSLYLRSHNCEHLKFVFLVINFLVIDSINNSSQQCFHVATAISRELSHSLELRRRREFEFVAIELESEAARKLFRFDKWVGAKDSLIPLFYERFQTKVAEHHHVLMLDHSFH